MFIKYYAAAERFYDSATYDIEAFRAWAEIQIEDTYPGNTVIVLNEVNVFSVRIDGMESLIGDEYIGKLGATIDLAKLSEVELFCDKLFARWKAQL